MEHQNTPPIFINGVFELILEPFELFHSQFAMLKGLIVNAKESAVRDNQLKFSRLEDA
jgi:hypothetical protein